MYDVDNLECPNPEEHPGRSIDRRGADMLVLPYETVSHLPGVYTKFCEACQRWVFLEVKGDVII